MTSFRVDPQPTTVVFGAGSVARISDEVQRFGWDRVAVLCTPGRRELAERVGGLLGARCSGVLDDAVMHVPSDAVTRAVDRLRELRADGCVSVGGGSAIGLAKILARDGHAGYVAVPTTYSGSEMTAVWGETSDGVKRTGRDPRVRPRAVVYDPNLTLGLSSGVTVTSAINALAHAAEALYAPDRSPLTDLWAERGAAGLISALTVLVDDPHDEPAREQALIGAWLSGSCLGATTMGLHHTLCHVLGGRYGLAHAETHTVLLPHVLASLLPAAPFARAVLARVLDTDRPATGLYQLLRHWGAPISLAELGMPDDGLTDVASVVAARAPAAPVRPDAGAVLALLRRAQQGLTPAAGP